MKLFNLLAALSLSTVLALSGFLVYLHATGHLTGTRLERIAAVLRGELDELPTTQPAESGAEENSETSEGGTAGTEAAGHGSTPAAPQAHEASRGTLAATKRPGPQERLELAWSLRDLDARQKLLERTLRQVNEEREKLAQERKATEEQQQRQKASDVQETAFQKELRSVKLLPAAQAKERIVRLWKKQPADAARLIKSLDPQRLEGILELLQSPAEADVQAAVREQLGQAGAIGARESGV